MQRAASGVGSHWLGASSLRDMAEDESLRIVERVIDKKSRDSLCLQNRSSPSIACDDRKIITNLRRQG